MDKVDIWHWIVYLLPVASYFIGIAKVKLQMPKEIRSLLANRDVMDMIYEGIKAAAYTQGKSNDEKREYVRKWAKSELFKLLGRWVPDSVINYLIEHIIATKGKCK
jgi:hypothetical protein